MSMHKVLFQIRQPLFRSTSKKFVLSIPKTVTITTRSVSNMSTTVSIGDQSVPVTMGSQVTRATSDILNQVLDFGPFKEWVSRLDKAQGEKKNEMDIRSIEVQNTDIFGSGKLGFVKLKADVRFKENGKSAPGIVFMVCHRI